MRWIPAKGATEKETDTSDFLGVLLLVIGIGSLQLLLQRSIGRNPFGSPELFGEAGIFAVSLVAPALRMQRRRSGLFQLAPFRDLGSIKIRGVPAAEQGDRLAE